MGQRHHAICEEEANGDFRGGATGVIGISFKVGGYTKLHPVRCSVDSERVTFPGEPVITIQT